jgi:hypothetical protein
VSDAVILALLGAVSAGIGLVFRELIADRNFYRERLFGLMDKVDEVVPPASKQAPGA